MSCNQEGHEAACHYSAGNKVVTEVYIKQRSVFQRLDWILIINTA